MKHYWRPAVLLCLCGILLMGAVSCGKKQEGTDQGQQQEIKDVSLAEIESAVAKAYGENYIPSMEYSQEELESVFGVDPELCEEFLAKGPMISAHVDTFAVIKAKEGKAGEVEKALEAYRDKLLNDTFQYPTNIPKIQVSQVKVYGDYVFFLMLGIVDDPEADTEEEQLQAFEEQNEIAVKAIEEVLYGI